MHSLPVEPSVALQLSFAILSLAVVLAVCLAARSVSLFGWAVAWMSLTGSLAYSGYLADFSTVPPRAALLLGGTFVLIVILAVSKTTERLVELPFQWLVGFQSFRIVVELLIHQAVLEGVAPVHMSFEGLNFDIVTGVSALLLAPFATRIPHWLLLAWNSIGLLLLISVVSVAVVSIPSPIQLLRPDNVWVASLPFVWLPTVLVLAAALGHIVLLKKLFHDTVVPQTKEVKKHDTAQIPNSKTNI